MTTLTSDDSLGVCHQALNHMPIVRLTDLSMLHRRSLTPCAPCSPQSHTHAYFLVPINLKQLSSMNLQQPKLLFFSEFLFYLKLFIFVCVFCLNVRVWATCVSVAGGGQKRASALLELEGCGVAAQSEPG